MQEILIDKCSTVIDETVQSLRETGIVQHAADHLHHAISRILHERQIVHTVPAAPLCGDAIAVHLHQGLANRVQRQLKVVCHRTGKLSTHQSAPNYPKFYRLHVKYFHLNIWLTLLSRLWHKLVPPQAVS